MIARIKVNDTNRTSVLNYIKINHPNYVLVDNYEILDRQNKIYSDKAEEQPTSGPTVLIEMEGDLSIRIKKEDYQKPGHKLIPMFITDTDYADMALTYSELLREIKTVSPAEKVMSFKNFEIRNGKVVKRDNELRSGETVFIIR